MSFQIKPFSFECLRSLHEKNMKINKYLPHFLIQRIDRWVMSSQVVMPLASLGNLHSKQRENEQIPAKRGSFWPFTLDDWTFWWRQNASFGRDKKTAQFPIHSSFQSENVKSKRAYYFPPYVLDARKIIHSKGAFFYFYLPIAWDMTSWVRKSLRFFNGQIITNSQ